MEDLGFIPFTVNDYWLFHREMEMLLQTIWIISTSLNKNIILQYVNILVPFKVATEKLSAENQPTVNQIIQLLDSMFLKSSSQIKDISSIAKKI
jgi:hypothetical protein